MFAMFPLTFCLVHMCICTCIMLKYFTFIFFLSGMRSMSSIVLDHQCLLVSKCTYMCWLYIMFINLLTDNNISYSRKIDNLSNSGQFLLMPIPIAFILFVNTDHQMFNSVYSIMSRNVVIGNIVLTNYSVHLLFLSLLLSICHLLV